MIDQPTLTALKPFGKMTRRQQNILRFVHRFVQAHGYGPTMREIATQTQISSTFIVSYNLTRLVEWGYLTKGEKWQSRTLQVRIAPPKKRGRQS